MQIAIPKERREAERRVAATPESVKKLIGLGATVRVEAGAGARSAYPDALYEAAGATIAPDYTATVAGADRSSRSKRSVAPSSVQLKIEPVGESSGARNPSALKKPGRVANHLSPPTGVAKPPFPMP